MEGLRTNKLKSLPVGDREGLSPWESKAEAGFEKVLLQICMGLRVRIACPCSVYIRHVRYTCYARCARCTRLTCVMRVAREIENLMPGVTPLNHVTCSRGMCDICISILLLCFVLGLLCPSKKTRPGYS